MDEHEQQVGSLANRVERLEIAIWHLQNRVEQLSLWNQTPARGIPPPTGPVASELQAAPLAPPEGAIYGSAGPPAQGFVEAPTDQRIDINLFPANFDLMRSSGWWLNKVGIGLLLLGLAFLFKYAVDRGWLTEQVRIGFGLALGSVLLITGLRLHEPYRHFSQVLMGGSIATYYLTGFAAYQLYHLVDYYIAFAFMVLVTILAFFLSVRQDGVALSLIGAAGGLATPFLLYGGARNIPGLVGYICLVLAGVGAIFFYRGWYSLLWTSFVGGWWIFLIATFTGIETSDLFRDYDRWALQGGAVFGLLVFGALPAVREVLSVRDPQKWPRPPRSWFAGAFAQEANPFVELSAHALTVMTPLITLGISVPIWGWMVSQRTWGWIAIVGAVAYALAALGLLRLQHKLAHAHALTAVMLLTIGVLLLLENDVLFVALAVEALAILLVSRRLLTLSLSAAAHLLFLGVGFWLAFRLTSGNNAETAVFNSKGLADLTVMALALAASFAIQPSHLAVLYRFAIHVAFLAWLWRELLILPDGKPYITVAWGVYALALLFVGIIRNRNQGILNIAIGTLFLVVAKLILVDLTLDEVWRILLFLSFGGVFLLLSYYFQVLMRGTSVDAKHEP